MGRTPHKKLMETDNDEDYALAWKALELVGMEGMANSARSPAANASGF